MGFFNWEWCWLSWTKDVTIILTQCDLGDLFNRDQWYRQSMDEVISHVRQRLVALERSQRQQDAATMCRMQLYRALNLEDLPQTPNYSTSTALSRRQRPYLAKLRMGTLPLVFETGRYVGGPLEDRDVSHLRFGSCWKRGSFLIWLSGTRCDKGTIL